MSFLPNFKELTKDTLICWLQLFLTILWFFLLSQTPLGTKMAWSSSRHESCPSSGDKLQKAGIPPGIPGFPSSAQLVCESMWEQGERSVCINCGLCHILMLHQVLCQMVYMRQCLARCSAHGSPLASVCWIFAVRLCSQNTFGSHSMISPICTAE